jgi:hypothetical protein
MPVRRSDVELAGDLDALSLEVVRRLKDAAENASDRVAADEVFVLAGQVEASLSAAAAQLSELREELDRRVRSARARA